ncbi:hypothetical protein Scep_002776 [Stephania cephalantha]|uniref:Uncharacterized protein n=1 Tax=Stephania cephalantha TaxID=152367 RepID=A0AAP0LBM6_9MAGN
MRLVHTSVMALDEPIVDLMVLVIGHKGLLCQLMVYITSRIGESVTGFLCQ